MCRGEEEEVAGEGGDEGGGEEEGRRVRQNTMMEGQREWRRGGWVEWVGR